MTVPERGLKMKLKQLAYDFAVCKLASADTVDFSKDFVFLSKTDNEISLVCIADDMPQNTTAIELGWKGLKICGILDFSMIGVLARISNILAKHEISIFVISTYNTDYIFLQSENYQKAIDILRDSDYIIE